MFLQKIMCLMDKFALSSEDTMHKDQGPPFACKQKVNLLLKAARTKIQGQYIPEDQDNKDVSSYEKTPYLDRGDNDV
jgi:hypothetical protein